MWAQQKKHDDQQQQKVPKEKAGPVGTKAPEVTTVTYPFSKDKGLVEMVRCYRGMQ